MELWMLALMVAVGLAVVIGLVHLSGGSREAVLERKAARERFMRDYPDTEFGDPILANDGRAALFVDAENADDKTEVGLVQVMGRHQITRLLDGDVLKSVSVEGDVIVLHLHDTTLPNEVIQISDEKQRAALVRKLRSIATTS